VTTDQRVLAKQKIQEVESAKRAGAPIKSLDVFYKLISHFIFLNSFFCITFGLMLPAIVYINNDELQDPRARAQGGNGSATKHSQN
jgi:hypothetical protein